MVTQIRLSCLWVCLFWTAGIPVFADTFCVDTAAGLNAALALAAANGGADVVQVQQGTYFGNFVFASSEPAGVTIEGGYTQDCQQRAQNPANTILDGSDADTVLALVNISSDAGPLTVEGLTIRNGNSAVTGGGGLFVDSSGNALIVRNVFEGNEVPGQSCTFTPSGLKGGGGVYVRAKKATFTDNEFTGNVAGCGGGLLAWETPFVEFEGNDVHNNTAMTNGGGTYVDGDFGTFALFRENDIHNNIGGGAVIAKYAGVFLRDNNVSDNTHSFGGAGIRIQGVGGSISLEDNIFLNNVVDLQSNDCCQGAGAVAAIANPNSVVASVFVSGNKFSGNLIEPITFQFREDGTVGGALDVLGRSVILRNNLFLDNTAASGGAVAARANEIVMVNNLLAGNAADLPVPAGMLTGRGGALLLETREMFGADPAEIILTGNSFNSNTAGAQGGGVWLGLVGDLEQTFLYNNIVYNNVAVVGGDLYLENDGNDNFFPSPVALENNNFDQSMAGLFATRPITVPTTNLDDVDPQFEDSQNDNFHLQAGSLLINAGQNGAPFMPATDLDGNPRLLAGTVDMGAYESVNGESDTDGDGIVDLGDNCVTAPNVEQRDTDGDGIGNACDPDLNNDCIINVIDLGLHRAAFFSEDPDNDFNGDGVVNAVDLGIMKAVFFSNPGPTLTPNACMPGTVILSAIDRGRYEIDSATGDVIHDPDNVNYVVGRPGVFSSGFCVICRNFFVFDLAGVDAMIDSATLRISNPPGGYGNINDSEPAIYQVWDVTTDPLVLMDGSGGSGAFNDFASGTLYGTYAPGLAEQGSTLEITLNAEALNALNNTVGLFALGGEVRPIGSTYLFAFTDFSVAPDVQLVLEVSPTN